MVTISEMKPKTKQIIRMETKRMEKKRTRRRRQRS